MSRSAGFFGVTQAEEANMGVLEISIVLACASAFGFFLTAVED